MQLLKNKIKEDRTLNWIETIQNINWTLPKKYAGYFKTQTKPKYARLVDSLHLAHRSWMVLELSTHCYVNSLQLNGQNKLNLSNYVKYYILEKVVYSL